MKIRILSISILFLFIATIPLNAQKKNKKITLSGYITDNKGNPVPGAKIQIDKINANKVSDAKGFYRVKIRPEATKMTVFSLECGSEEVLIEGRTTINIALNGEVSVKTKTQNKPEENETVNIGYGVVNKKDMTSPVNKLDVTSSRYASYSNIYEVLNGAIPGVQVSGKRITVQGASSFYGDTQPLIVVDGIVAQSLDDIIPSQVKSIEVLKGSSASIYGSRGANGVILINLINGSGKRY